MLTFAQSPPYDDVTRSTPGGTPYPLVYDKLIRCLGWKHDQGIYTDETRPWMQHNGKYPTMTSEYESRNVEGLFFAGQLSHGKDFRRAAGGFIHGFRYTARALFRVLEQRYHSDDFVWPGGSFDNVQTWDGNNVGLAEFGCNRGDWGVDQGDVACPSTPSFDVRSYVGLVDKVFSRINTGSGIYQMVGVLGDGIVFNCPANSGDTVPLNGVHAHYGEEVPLDYFNWRFDGLPRVFVQFGYAQQSRSLHDSKQTGTLFQVHIWYYYGDCAATPSAVRSPKGTGSENPPPARRAMKKEVFKIYEDLHTYWNTWELRLRFAKWLHAKVVGMVPGSVELLAEEWDPDHGQCDQAAIKPSLKACIEQVPATKACLEEKRVAGVGGVAALCQCITDSKQTQQCLGSCYDPAVQLLSCSRDQAAGGNAGKPLLGERDATIAWYNWSPISDIPNADFQGGRVDFNLENRLDEPVKITQYTTFEKPGAPGAASGAGAGTERGMLHPGEGARFVSHERERWLVEKAGGDLVLEWEVDIAHGIVQDVVIGG
jgi:hypothetical protein